MPPQVTIHQRFVGPPDMGNGGYVAGAVAAFIEGPARIKLARPTPLDRPLPIVRTPSGGALLQDQGETLVEGEPTQLTLSVPAPPDFATARRLMADSVALQRPVHPICFVCSAQRDENDGLRIHPGRVEDTMMVAAAWTPDASLADARGLIDPIFLWSALDCPGAYAFMIDRKPGFLGTLSGSIEGEIRPGEECVVIGWQIGSSGRKLLAGSAIFNAANQLCGRAEAIWIEAG